jgi:hypothetical protein
MTRKIHHYDARNAGRLLRIAAYILAGVVLTIWKQRAANGLPLRLLRHANYHI